MSSIPAGHVQLLYAKSKVYVHPTKSARDNVPGFLYLIKESPLQTDGEIHFGWCAESVLEPDQLLVLQQVDMNTPDAASPRYVKRLPRYGSFSFAAMIAELYSFQFRPPTLGWWHGSIIINTKSTSDRLPVLFFHDDESPSTVAELNNKTKQFEIFTDENELFWGGLQFMAAFKQFARLERTSLERSIFLVNPTIEDLNNFSPSNALDASKSPNENSINKAFTKESLNKFMADAKWNLLGSFAKLTTFTKKHLEQIPLDKTPIPTLLSNPEVNKINDEFDTARVYLAKWAMGVQEEAQRNRERMMLDQGARDFLEKELGIGFDKLLPEEIQAAHERREVSEKEWRSMFDSSGRLRITVNEVKARIFHGGCEDIIRREVWLFLLEVYPWDSSKDERHDLRLILDNDYKTLKARWKIDEELHKDTDEYFKDQLFRIDKDIQRTDRHLPIFQRSLEEEQDEGSENLIVRNVNLIQMREVLITFNELNKCLGYVQGMNDLLAPIYIQIHGGCNSQDGIMGCNGGSTGLVFWAFVKMMDRMERNFLHDQSGMKDQMTTLNELVQFMLPKLYVHLDKCDSGNLFFFFRMLLVWFKREFPLSDIYQLWEVLWTDFYSSQFHLFVALAILQKNEKIIVAHLTQFDEVLKYVNDLSMTYELKDLLTRAELLFLKFRKAVEIIDRGAKPDGLSPISDNLRGLLSRDIVIQKETERHDG